MDAPELGSLLDVDVDAEVSVLRFAEGIEHREPVSTIIDTPTHLVIVIGEDAQVTIEVTVRSKCAMEIIAERNSSVTVVCVQQTSGSIRQRSSLQDGASMTFQNITLASEVEHLVQSDVQGRGATSNINWIFYATDTDSHTIRACNMFDGAEGSGEIIMKGVAEQNAYVKCDGFIHIGLQGAGTDTYLTEDVLMLDDTAKVDALPSLEIKTNDVKASHSATISKVTPEDLFYFASRGIAETEARHMYVQGFLGDLTQKIDDQNCREAVNSYINAKFEC